MEYLMSGGLLLFLISSLVVINKEITKRPTYKDVEDKYTEIKLCKEIHKTVNEKLDCLPEMKKSLTQIETKIDILIKNGK